MMKSSKTLGGAAIVLLTVLGVMSPLKSAAQTYFFDKNGNYKIDDEELLILINYWAQGRDLPLLAVPTPTPTPVGPLQKITITLPGDVPMTLVRISAGSFMMGSPDDEKDRGSNEGPQHRVTITQDFHMGQSEVTQAQWEAVMGSNPAKNYGVGNDYPVYDVSWNDCQEFINKLNELGQGTFRLPTEAEWEYACRAGTTTRFYWGDDPSYSEIGKYAWYRDNSGSKTHGVGQKIPNQWGLYDMSGNLWEWCQDWYSDSYPNFDQVDPTGPLSGSSRVLRGGSWYSGTWNLQSAYRHWDPPSDWFDSIGFRVVRTP